ncbi:MAG: hypothetical protein R2795_19600 [Saprospiraceae bacterium]
MENICLGHEDINFQQVVQAVKEAGLESFVQGLPQGYNTLMVPGGRDLSQSIRTRIILARSIVSRPKFLALEEFLHQLQPNERERMCDMLAARTQPWTLVAVSNDPIFASRCERIILMKDGQIVADGTYNEIQRTLISSLFFN